MTDIRANFAITGAGGRMGRQLVALADSVAGLRLAAAWVGAGSGLHGQAVPGTSLSYEVLGNSGEAPAVVVDFSHADAFDAVLAWCRQAGVALVSGTTGLTDGQRAAMAAAAADIPVLWSANYSLGVAVLKRVVAEAARLLPDWQAEIVEAHHAGKRDAPSGTALALGEAVAGARGSALSGHAVFDRHDRDRGRCGHDIGFAVIRAGDIVGEHNVILASAGERLELGHRAGDRAIFARGALLAARWLASRPPGAYRFEDILDEDGRRPG